MRIYSNWIHELLQFGIEYDNLVSISIHLCPPPFSLPRAGIYRHSMGCSGWSPSSQWRTVRPRMLQCHIGLLKRSCNSRKPINHRVISWVDSDSMILSGFSWRWHTMLCNATRLSPSVCMKSLSNPKTLKQPKSVPLTSDRLARWIFYQVEVGVPSLLLSVRLRIKIQMWNQLFAHGLPIAMNFFFFKKIVVSKDWHISSRRFCRHKLSAILVDDFFSIEETFSIWG